MIHCIKCKNKCYWWKLIIWCGKGKDITVNNCLVYEEKI